MIDALPKSVTNELNSTFSPINQLNSVLKNENLIELVKSEQTITIPDEIYSEVIAQIPLLTQEELMQLNRLFLEETYPSLCPKIETTSAVFNEILPLVAVEFGSLETEDEVDADVSRSAINSSLEYEQQRKKIVAEYQKYKEFWSKDFSNLLDKKAEKDKNKTNEHLTVKWNDTKIGLGYQGHFSSTWGSLSTGVKGAVFISLSTIISARYTIDAELGDLELVKGVSIPLTSGPISVSLTPKVYFNMPLHADIPTETDVGMKSAFTGLYGAEFDVGLSYGIKWKKVWLIKVPTTYVNWNSSAGPINKTAYYIEPTSSLVNSKIIDANISINPKIRLALELDLLKIVGGDFSIQPGLKPTLNFSYKNKKFEGTGILFGTFDTSVGVFVGLKDVDIVKPYQQRWNLSRSEFVLGKWNIPTLN